MGANVSKVLKSLDSEIPTQYKEEVISLIYLDISQHTHHIIMQKNFCLLYLHSYLAGDIVVPNC